MNVLMRGRDLIGHPVVEIRTGRDVAEVKDVVFDATRGIVTGFTLRHRGTLGRRMKDVLPVDGVVGVGTHAVMIEDAQALQHRDEAHGTLDAPADRDVLDSLVVTESGHSLGQVRDVVVVGGSRPRVVAFEVGGGRVGEGLVPLDAAAGVSGSALVVPDAYEQRVRRDLTGLAAELNGLEGRRS